MAKCPDCGKDYKHLGRHWNYNPEHRPSLKNETFEILKGLMMGDGCVNNVSKNPKIVVECTQKDYLKYLDKKLGCLTTGVKHAKTPEENAESIKNSDKLNGKVIVENFSHTYRLTTRTHPEIKQFEEWYNPNKTYPEDLNLTYKSFKHWYCGDGTYRKSKTIAIGLSNEIKNKEKIIKMFEKSQLPSPDTWIDSEKNKSITWNTEKTAKILKKIEPVPGYRYKFPTHL